MKTVGILGLLQAMPPKLLTPIKQIDSTLNKFVHNRASGITSTTSSRYFPGISSSVTNLNAVINFQSIVVTHQATTGWMFVKSYSSQNFRSFVRLHVSETHPYCKCGHIIFGMRAWLQYSITEFAQINARMKFNHVKVK